MKRYIRRRDGRDCVTIVTRLSSDANETIHTPACHWSVGVASLCRKHYAVMAKDLNILVKLTENWIYLGC